MSTRARIWVGVIAISCGIAAVASATPIVGFLGTILATGSTTEETVVKAHVPLPDATKHDEDDGWSAKLITSGPSDFIVQDGTYAPGGHTGWHSHPGILLISVISGSLEWYDADCERHVYNAGDALTEGTRLHYFRNVGTVPVHFTVTYVIAHGQARRVDEAAPECAAALGLN